MELDGIAGISFERPFQIDEILQTRRVDVRDRAEVEDYRTENRSFVLARFILRVCLSGSALLQPGVRSGIVPIPVLLVFKVLSTPCVLFRVVEDDIGVEGGVRVQERFLEPEDDEAERRGLDLDERVRDRRTVRFERYEDVAVGCWDICVFEFVTEADATEESSSGSSDPEEEKGDRRADGDLIRHSARSADISMGLNPAELT